MNRYIFEGVGGFGRWKATARGRDEAEAAQRVARRVAGRRAGAYPALAHDGEPGWCVATPEATDLARFRCVEAGGASARPPPTAARSMKARLLAAASR